MRRPNITDYHISEIEYNLIRLRKSDDLEQKYSLIFTYKESRRKRRSAIIAIVLVVVVSALATYWLCRNDIKPLIIFVLLLLYPMYGVVISIIERIDKPLPKDPSPKEKQHIVELFYIHDISPLDYKHFQQYEDAMIKFRATPTLVKWQDIQFRNGEIVFIIKVFDGEYTLIYKNSIEIYDDYKILVIDILPQIFVYIQEGNVMIKNRQEFDEAVGIIIKRYQQDRQLLRNYNSENQDSIRTGIQDRGTEYMKYLLSRQVKGLGVIVDKEMVLHATSTSIDFEKAYIFTLLSKHGNRYIVVYENMKTDVNRSSIICDVPIEDYSSYIPAVVSYMGREKIDNRRQKLHKTHEIKRFTIDHAPHGDFLRWVNKIEGLSKERRTYSVYTRTYTRRRKRHWPW